ncbi:MAG: hypothetical protein OXF89_13800 [Rhodospirillaceae bacterium]|nr:hypothetical protein [Rhodospirillaceae bacterium]
MLLAKEADGDHASEGNDEKDDQYSRRKQQRQMVGKAAPIASLFIDWLFVARDGVDAKTEVQAAGRRALRARRGRR